MSESDSSEQQPSSQGAVERAELVRKIHDAVEKRHDGSMLASYEVGEEIFLFHFTEATHRQCHAAIGRCVASFHPFTWRNAAQISHKVEAMVRKEAIQREARAKNRDSHSPQ